VNRRVDLLARILSLRARKWVGYAAGLLGALLGYWEHVALGQALASATFLTFFPAIFLASLVGGRAAGVFATIISACLAMYYLIPPVNHLAVAWPGGWVEVGSFFIVAATMIALIDYTVATSAKLAETTALLRGKNDDLAAQERRRAAQLQEKETLIQTFFTHSSQCHVVVVVTADGKFRYEEINPATLQLYGLARGQVIGFTVDDLFDADTAAELNAHLTHCLQLNEPYRYERVTGEAIIEALATPVPSDDGITRRLIITAGDVTRRRHLEEQLRQSQKMEAVGQLTGGLAHDFNNLLTGISGSIELLETRIAQGRMDDVQRYILTAKGAAKRAASLTHRLLAFSRRQTLDAKPTDLNRLVADLDELVRRIVGPAIAVELVAAADLWLTLVDQNQLENAVLNLCINARDAMPDGGRLTVETGNTTLDERAATERDLPAGQYVSLRVSDTGVGMTPAVAARAFDPFFTTKPLGEGTGLGLSMVYGFVRQSSGQARIDAEPGAGTTVWLYLPRHIGEPEARESGAGIVKTSPLETGEVALVVDDEASIRMLVTEVLEELGFTSIEAEDGQAGLGILESGRRIDLMITDVGLPGGINGRQLADAGLVLRPDLKVLFITGYAENAVMGNGHLKRGMHVLTKPFAMDELARRVRDVMA
jgi:PAS domain S-box-containing protein